jgi:hypothetical protein
MSAKVIDPHASTLIRLYTFVVAPRLRLTAQAHNRAFTVEQKGPVHPGIDVSDLDISTQLRISGDEVGRTGNIPSGTISTVAVYLAT